MTLHVAQATLKTAKRDRFAGSSNSAGSATTRRFACSASRRRAQGRHRARRSARLRASPRASRGPQRQTRTPARSDGMLRQMGVEFHSTNRGGDITYHGPGQIVGYPILQLGADSPRRGLVCAPTGRGHDASATAAFGVAAFAYRMHGRLGAARRHCGAEEADAARRRKSSALSACTSAAGLPRTVSPTTCPPICAISI